MTDEAASNETAELLRERSYMMTLGARFISTFGVQIVLVTIAWQIYNIARAQGMAVNQAAFVLSIMGLIQFTPLLFLAPIAGQVADHYDRKTILRLTLVVDILTATALAIIEYIRPSLAPMFVIAAVFGVSRAFMMPASGALVPMLVPRRLMPRAVAWSSLSFQAALITGPAIGGLIIAKSSTAAYVTAGCCYVIAIILLTGIDKPTRPERSGASRWAMIREGLAYVREQKIVLGAISLDLFAVLFGGAVLLLPAFANDVLKVGPEGFGVMRAAPGVGAALVAAWLAAHPVKHKAGIIMFVAVGIFAVATIVFGAARPITHALHLPQAAYPLSLAALATLGGADMVSVYIRQTLVQIVTPDHMRGRVAAVSSLFISASNELGEFESGLVARFLGPIGAAIFGGVGALIVTGTWSRLFPDLRKADTLADD